MHAIKAIRVSAGMSQDFLLPCSHANITTIRRPTSLDSPDWDFLAMRRVMNWRS